ncbi:hypothetical protein ABIA30_002592 [Mycobacterium sp. MAA66]|uniref:hypothetical protein n=1 Tax=Mycobacterium sp. MAA66 TaxID=3156297 RepID=UPI003515ADF6
MRASALAVLVLASTVAGAIALAPLSSAAALSKHPAESSSSQSNDRSRSDAGPASTTPVVSPPSSLLSGLHHNA